jgi:hypothetical protein
MTAALGRIAETSPASVLSPFHISKALKNNKDPFGIVFACLDNKSIGRFACSSQLCAKRVTEFQQSRLKFTRSLACCSSRFPIDREKDHFFNGPARAEQQAALQLVPGRLSCGFLSHAQVFLPQELKILNLSGMQGFLAKLRHSLPKFIPKFMLDDRDDPPTLKDGSLLRKSFLIVFTILKIREN